MARARAGFFLTMANPEAQTVAARLTEMNALRGGAEVVRRAAPETAARTIRSSQLPPSIKAEPSAGAVDDYPFSPMSDLPQWVGNSAAGKSAAERRGRSSGGGW